MSKKKVTTRRSGAGPALRSLPATSTIPSYMVEGKIIYVRGLKISCRGLKGLARAGDICLIDRRRCNQDEYSAERNDLLAEVVGLDGEEAHLLLYGEPDGIGLGTPVRLTGERAEVRPAPDWLGRVLDPFAQALDNAPPPAAGPRPYPLQARPVPAPRRRPLGPRLDLGVRALNLFTPCCRGQRMGIFAGSGVGKSTLLSMLARHSDADVLVVGLIGERGREVNAFLEETLDPPTRARTIVVAATSDQPAMMRRRGTLLTLTLAEAFRDHGFSVLCLLDSVTRYAMALREIGLATGEPPTSKGYPPSVFAELPRVLERAGTGAGAGSITGLFTVLVEGDDLNEPIADAVRGILDGHIVLDRTIAEKGRYPAVDIGRSLSRSAPGCYGAEERLLVRRAREVLRTHAEMADLIQLGAYRAGTDPTVDEAIRLQPVLDALLAQDPDQPSVCSADFAALADLLDEPA